MGRIDARDVAIVVGLACLFAGLVMTAGVGVALIVNGALALAGGVVGYLRPARKR